MEKQVIPAIISVIMVLVIGCSENNDDETLGFMHESSRPQCRYNDDPDRVAYYNEQVVVATDWGEPEMVITGYVGEPSLVADGNIMYFVHVLVDDDGVFGSNIWYVKRK